MEALQEYRHIIDKKTKDIFVKSVKGVISNNKFRDIGFVGIVGSIDKEYSHDIDLLIFPSKNAKIGDAISSIVKFYDSLDKELKRHHERFYIAITPKKSTQEMVYYLASLQEGGAGLIPIHSLFFPDYKSFKKFNPENFQKEIKKNLITLHGEFGVIHEIRNDISQSKLEPYFVILDFEMSSKLKTFPKHLIRTSAESLFSYLHSKYNIPLSKKKHHNILDIEREIFRMLKYLDSVTYD